MMNDDGMYDYMATCTMYDVWMYVLCTYITIIIISLRMYDM